MVVLALYGVEYINHEGNDISVLFAGYWLGVVAAALAFFGGILMCIAGCNNPYDDEVV